MLMSNKRQFGKKYEALLFGLLEDSKNRGCKSYSIVSIVKKLCKVFKNFNNSKFVITTLACLPEWASPL
jgi:hypothetical protein